ncbi:MAG: preprotein translocase subunit SecG [Deltaproteobacteria bacterium]|nr:preprotein translocase subunit SecG [Deltaproteobacteria bacterium]
MQILVVAIHVIVCFALIMIVLLQTGKGADIGAAFGGGSSQTLFGSSGAGNLLTKATTIAAIVFMCTSLALAYMSSQKHQGSVMKSAPVKEEAPVPPTGGANGLPAMPPAAGSGVIPKIPLPATGAGVPAVPVQAPQPAANTGSVPASLPEGVKVEATTTAKATIPASGGAGPVKVTIPATGGASAQPVKVSVPATAPVSPAAPALQPASEAPKAPDVAK